jgi:AraC family transcriptional regulator, regulatory protein of adaptative response / methylphosphotriester-DNA alkyltransferase methyltransferase
MRPDTRQTQTQLLAEAMSLIKQNYGDPELGLAAVAKELAVSPRQLQRIFHRIAGTTFRAQVEETRMHTARRLLIERQLSSREIAARVGYRQPAAFAKAFRRYFSAAPFELRELSERSIE